MRLSFVRAVVGAVVIGLLIGCGDSTTPSSSSTPASLQLISGQGQTAEAGTLLPQPLTVRVLDSTGNVVRKWPVRFSVLGGGQVDSALVLSDDSGFAAVHWTLGAHVRDSQAVEVHLRSGQTQDFLSVPPVVFTAIATIGKALSVAIVSGNGQTAPLGSALPQPVVATVVDAHGNPIAGDTVTWTVLAGGGTVSASSGVVDSLGGTSVTWTLGTRLDTVQVLEAGSGALHSVGFSANGRMPADAFILRVAGDSQTTQVATPFPDSVVVKAVLHDGRPIQGARVFWREALASNQDGLGSGSASPDTGVTDAAGVTRTSLIADTAAGEEDVTVITLGSQRLSASFTAFGIPGPLTRIHVLSHDSQPGTPGQPLDFPVSAQAVDHYGNGIAGVSVAWAVTAGGGSITPTSTSGPTGVATATWTLGATPGRNAATATAAGFAPATFSALGTQPVASVAVGPEEQCLLTTPGYGSLAYCWGSNEQGAFQSAPDCGGACSLNPVPLVGSPSYSQIVMSVSPSETPHTCGLDGSGRAWCWGGNHNGQLGDGSTTARTAPTSVVGGHTFFALAAGNRHVCGIAVDSLAYCWGSDSFGALGVPDSSLSQQCSGGGSPRCSNVPVQVQGGFHFFAIAAGGDLTCGLTGPGTAYCWGANALGQVGDGDTASAVDTPTPVIGGLTFTQLAAGNAHACGVTAGGTAYCWGRNTVGALGLGTADADPHPAPTLVTGSHIFQSLTGGGDSSCGLTTTGAVYCWGTGVISPAPRAAGVVFSSIRAGLANRGCGISTLSAVFCWTSAAVRVNGP